MKLRSQKENVIGNVYGRLTVISVFEKKKNGTLLLCQCECGKTHIVYKHSLESEIQSVCGCLRKENTHNVFFKHGCSMRKSDNFQKNKTYIVWKNIIHRCRYKYVGGEGLEVYDNWKDFNNFLNDVGEAPLKTRFTRIDKEKGFFPENCEWRQIVKK